MKQNKKTSSKSITIDNSLLEELAQNKSIKYHHINLLAYLKDRATLKEGNLRFIKEISLLDINKFIDGDVKCRTAKKLLNELIDLELIYVDPSIKITPKKVFTLTLDTRVTKQSYGNFTVLPEGLIHSYPIGISTYLAIRSYHSEQAKISISQIQKRSKVSKREIQYKIIKELERLGFIDISVGGYNNANTYICTDYSNIEFERIYNKYTGRPKNDIQEHQEETTDTTITTNTTEELDNIKVFKPRHNQRYNSEKDIKKELENSHLPSSSNRSKWM